MIKSLKDQLLDASHPGLGLVGIVRNIESNQILLANKLDEVIKVLNGDDNLRTAVNVARYRSKDGV